MQDSRNNTIEFTKIDQETDEQDMANCLILLAQSPSTAPPPQHESNVYECKTCNRGFPSFQALGGHRASHKKPSRPNTLGKQDMHIDHSSTDLSLQVGSNPSGSMIMKVGKVHECSICGAEFGSGQALGGHMRRHRSMPVVTTDCGGSGMCQEAKKPKTLLSLDLNLPAPVEDDHLIRETKFGFGSKDQMIVFSNSSLVRCHI